jgi:hypothetical protein
MRVSAFTFPHFDLSLLISSGSIAAIKHRRFSAANSLMKETPYVVPLQLVNADRAASFIGGYDCENPFNFSRVVSHDSSHTFMEIVSIPALPEFEMVNTHSRFDKYTDGLFSRSQDERVKTAAIRTDLTVGYAFLMTTHYESTSFMGLKIRRFVIFFSFRVNSVDDSHSGSIASFRALLYCSAPVALTLCSSRQSGCLRPAP